MGAHPAVGAGTHGGRSLARWALLVLAFLLALEASARVEDRVRWGAPFLEVHTPQRLTVVDSLGFRNRPGYRFGKWRINTLGFRGPEIDPEPRPGVVRVGVLGASETFGTFESEGGEYPARLQEELEARMPGRFEVVNLAMAGMGLPAMRGYYNRVVRPVKPDLVLVYPSPSFYLDSEPPRVPMPGEGVGVPPADRARRDALERLLHLRMDEKGRDLLRRFVPGDLRSAVRRRQVDRARAEGGSGWAWEGVPPDRIELLAEHAALLVREIRDSGAQPVLVTHVNRFMKPSEEFTRDDLHHVMALLSLYPRASAAILGDVDRAANAVLREVARREGIPLLDVEGRIPPTGDFFADYAHFTDRGALEMAGILAEGIVRIVSEEEVQP